MTPQTRTRPRLTSTSVRASLARLFRAGPHFPGKQRLSAYLNRRLLADGPDANPVRMRDGSRLRLDPRSETEWPAYWSGEYDAAIITRLALCLPRGAVAIDVGANVGFYSVALGRRVREIGGHTYAIEPVPSNYARLCENIALNNLDAVVTAVPVALGDRAGEAALYRDDRNNAATGNAVVVGTAVQARPNATARLTTLDRLAADRCITECHLLKLDVEGSEYDCLRGAGEFLSRHRPLIYCELNSDWMSKFRWSFADLREHMHPFRYQFWRADGKPYSGGGEGAPANDNVLMVPEGTEMESQFRRQFRPRPSGYRAVPRSRSR